MRGRGVVLFGGQEGAKRGHTGFSVDAWAGECKVAGGGILLPVAPIPYKDYINERSNVAINVNRLQPDACR